MSWVLKAAAVYNVLWGAWVVLLPHQFWALLDMQQPNYPFLWQCIGMIVGVYGVGYWFAAGDPVRHWPIVLVGFLGKIFGPIGFLDAWLLRDMVPLRFGATLITNDLVWWVPFALILWHAFVENTRRRDAERVSEAVEQPTASTQTSHAAREAMRVARTNEGASLAELSRRGPVLVVFLRHLGCTFCREALADVAAQRARLDARGVRVCLVHMVDDAQARSMAEKYGLGDVARVSDPAKALYGAFELARGSLAQLFGPRLWLRGFQAGVLGGHWVGKLQGDGFQMPGAFLIRDESIVRAYRHADAADRPDYCTLAACEPAARSVVAHPA